MARNKGIKGLAGIVAAAAIGFSVIGCNSPDNIKSNVEVSKEETQSYTAPYIPPESPTEEQKESFQRRYEHLKAITGYHEFDAFILDLDGDREVRGRTLELFDIGMNRSVGVSVDGESKIISEGDTHTVNGLEVTNYLTTYASPDLGLSYSVLVAYPSSIIQGNPKIENLGEMIDRFRLENGESKTVEGKTITLKWIEPQGRMFLDVDNTEFVLKPGSYISVDELIVRNFTIVYSTGFSTFSTPKIEVYSESGRE